MNDGPPVFHNFIGPRFFDTMGILLEGREFRLEDDQRAPRVAVISEGVARTYFPGASAIGRRIRSRQGEFGISGHVGGQCATRACEAPRPSCSISRISRAHRASVVSCLRCA